MADQETARRLLLDVFPKAPLSIGRMSSYSCDASDLSLYASIMEGKTWFELNKRDMAKLVSAPGTLPPDVFAEALPAFVLSTTYSYDMLWSVLRHLDPKYDPYARTVIAALNAEQRHCVYTILDAAVCKDDKDELTHLLSISEAFEISAE